MASHHLGAAPIRHAHAVLVHVRARDAGRSANHGTVRTRRPIATSVKRYPQIVIVASTSDVWSLDCAVVVGAAGDGDDAGAGALSCARVDRDHLDTRPEGAKGEPPVARGIDNEVGVDCVVVNGVGRLDDHALVGPRSRGCGRTRGQEDGRLTRAKGRCGVVHVVLPVVEGDVGGPEIGVAASVRCRPGRAVGERGAGIAPHGAVGRCLQRHVGSCVGHDIGAARALEDGWVVDGSATRNGARVGILRAYTGRDGRHGQKAAEQLSPYGRHFQKRFEVARGFRKGHSCVWPVSLLGENCGRSECIQEAKREDRTWSGW